MTIPLVMWIKQMKKRVSKPRDLNMLGGERVWPGSELAEPYSI